MSSLSLLKKIKAIFTPCTVRLNLAIEEHEKVCADAQVRMKESGTKLLDMLASSQPDQFTNYPQFAHVVNRRHVNPR